MITALGPRSISVVVPTLGNGMLLERLADSFRVAASNYPGQASLVVCDASDPEDAELIASAVHSVDGTYLTATSRGASCQRNQGAAIGNSDVVLFVDSDCVLTPDLLVEVDNGFRTTSAVAIAGRVRFFGDRGFVFRSVSTSGILDGFEGFGLESVGRVPWGPTANFAILRSALTEIGGFDGGIGIPRPGGEDVDLGLRLSKCGGTIMYVPTAIVLHPTEPWDSVIPMFRRLVAYGRGDVQLMARHRGIALSAGPNLVTAGVVATAILGAGAIIHTSATFLLLIPLWIATAFIVASAHNAFSAPRGSRRTASALPAFFIVLDGARFLRAVSQRRWSTAFAYPLLEQKQLFREWRGVLSSWAAACIATLLVLISAMTGVFT